MAQTTQITIDNQTFPSFRSKLNESLSALNTLNSGTSRPSSAVAGTIWLDTTNSTNPTLKFFDGTDDISLATIDYTANTVNWLDSSVSLTSPVEISGNSTAGAEIRLPEDTDNGSNYVGLKASDSIPSNITFTLPNADGTDGQAIKTDGSGNLSFGDAGRLGSVNWQTGDIKTATFTASDGEGYFCNTTSSSLTINLPAGSSGAIVAVNDYANTASTNNIIISANGSEKIEGSTTNHVILTNGITVTLVYVDSTQGWKLVDTGESSSLPEQSLFTSATGGTITCCGDYKIHTFTSPGTFSVTQLGNGPSNPSGGPNTVSYMVVAGGGGQTNPGHYNAGGGAGGFREGRDIGPSYTASPLVAPGLTISATSYPITVGGGGGANGGNSIFSTITSAGGGGGGSPGQAQGNSGGSGGGGSPFSPASDQVGGAGNTPPVSPPQGNSGGTGKVANPPTAAASGGGGGATQNGGNAGPFSYQAGDGGNGATTSISGSSTTYAGGGGGVTYNGADPTGGSGGTGGGGDGGKYPNNPASTNGTANTGGGAGGDAGFTGPTGGSGIVIIRYKFQ